MCNITCMPLYMPLYMHTCSLGYYILQEAPIHIHVGMYIYTYPSVIYKTSLQSTGHMAGIYNMHASVWVNEVLYNPVAWAGTCLTGHLTWMGLVTVGAGDGCRCCVQW